MIEYNIQELLTSVWPEWKIVRHIGEGGSGNVYLIKRDLPNAQEAALKVIRLPKDPLLLDLFEKNPESHIALRLEYEKIVQDVSNEIAMMYTLQKSPHIVHLEDHYIYQDPQTFSWTILIRMELLRPVLYFCPMSEKEVLKLGIDICSALEDCSSHNILHRDIKPSNLFMNSCGDYKLGDFGISKVLQISDETTTDRCGTPSYMAPELLSDKPYDCRADLYSLGLVLYTLLNENKQPFLPLDKQICSYQEHMNAYYRRVTGETLPAPVNASEATVKILKQACAFHPKDRYENASHMKKALTEILENSASADHSPVSSRKHMRIFLPVIGLSAISLILLLLLQNQKTGSVLSASETADSIPSSIEIQASEQNADESMSFAENSVSTVFTYRLSEDGTQYAVTGLQDITAEHVIIPDFYNGIPVTSIDENAFTDSKLKSIILPDSILYIGESAFQNCLKLSHITLSSKLQRIGPNAFWGAALESVYIPASVEIISANAFTCCHKLKQILVDPENPEYHASGNCLVHTKERMLLFGCQNSVIPMDGSVQIIHEFAFFQQKNLHSIHIPEGIISIEKYAFTSVPLSELNIPSTLISVHETAFNECVNIEKIHVHKDNPKFSTSGNCLIDSQTKTLIAAFPSSIIPEDGSITCIGTHAFYNARIEEINIPNSVLQILNAAFNGNNITNIRIPEGNRFLLQYTFRNCINLETITIPASMERIDEYAFDNCPELKTIYFTGTAKQWKELRVNTTGNANFLNAEIVYVSAVP